MWFAQERVAEVALVVRIGDGVCQRPLTLTRRSADDDDGSSAVIQPLDDKLFAVRVVTIDDCRTGACSHGLFLTDVARDIGARVVGQCPSRTLTRADVMLLCSLELCLHQLLSEILYRVVPHPVTQDHGEADANYETD